MSPKLTIAYESVDASPAPAANPGDRIDAMFEAAEERHRAARRVVSMLLRALVYLGALLTTAVLLFLVGYILVNGVPYLTPSLFEWEYNSTNVSLMPALVNTLLMAALSLLMAVPVGVGSAIYLVEYAPRGSRFVAVVRTTAETLQGIPDGTQDGLALRGIVILYDLRSCFIVAAVLSLCPHDVHCPAGALRRSPESRAYKDIHYFQFIFQFINTSLPCSAVSSAPVFLT